MDFNPFQLNVWIGWIVHCFPARFRQWSYSFVLKLLSVDYMEPVGPNPLVFLLKLTSFGRGASPGFTLEKATLPGSQEWLTDMNKLKVRPLEMGRPVGSVDSLHSLLRPWASDTHPTCVHVYGTCTRVCQWMFTEFYGCACICYSTHDLL